MKIFRVVDVFGVHWYIPAKQIMCIKPWEPKYIFEEDERSLTTKSKILFGPNPVEVVYMSETAEYLALTLEGL